MNTPEEKCELVLRVTQGDTEARNQLVLTHLGLVNHIARRYRSASHEFAELVAIGSIGLVNAVDRYELGHGARLGTYAYHYIRWAIVDALLRTKRHASLDQIIFDNTTLGDLQQSPHAGPEEVANQSMERDRLLDALDTLSPRDQRILRLRYGLDRHPMSLREVGDILNLTGERVRQIEVDSIRLLHKVLGN